MSKALDDLIAESFDPSARLYLDVPEWVVDGKPYRFSYTPVTVADIAAITELAQGNPAMMPAATLAIKLCEADGSKYFDRRIDGKDRISKRWPPEIVGRLYQKIMPDVADMSGAELEKN